MDIIDKNRVENIKKGTVFYFDLENKVDFEKNLKVDLRDLVLVDKEEVLLDFDVNIPDDLDFN